MTKIVSQLGKVIDLHITSSELSTLLEAIELMEGIITHMRWAADKKLSMLCDNGHCYMTKRGKA